MAAHRRIDRGDVQSGPFGTQFHWDSMREMSNAAAQWFSMRTPSVCDGLNRIYEIFEYNPFVFGKK